MLTTTDVALIDVYLVTLLVVPILMFAFAIYDRFRYTTSWKNFVPFFAICASAVAMFLTLRKANRIAITKSEESIWAFGEPIIEFLMLAAPLYIGLFLLGLVLMFFHRKPRWWLWTSGIGLVSIVLSGAGLFRIMGL